MEEHYLMWLSRINGIGFKKFKDLIEALGSAENVWNSTKEQLLSVAGIYEKNANEILSNVDADKLDDWIAELEEKDIQFYSYYSQEYPKLLKQIYNPPKGLYIKGNLPDSNIQKVSIVGARKCTRYGATMAEQIGKDLSKHNIVVVSGMAKGIDAMAHKGAILGGGNTIAVLGCGVDICYPKENERLMQEIIEQGCVMSEYPPSTKVVHYHFPQRNRIIAGLSEITVVVEAGKKSGTLITVDMALENGREVFAVPGNATSHLSEGTNELIKQGATLITDCNDILHELKIAFDDEELSRFMRTIPLKMGADEREIYNCIRDKVPTTIDKIMLELNKPIQDIQYMLTLLEISGVISKSAEGGYIREN